MSVIDPQVSGKGVAPEEFNRWLRTLYGRATVLVPALCAAIILISTLGAGISSLFGTLTAVTEFVKGPWFKISLVVFQMLVCMVLLFLVPKPRVDRNLSQRASRAMEQFIEAWERLWLAWVLLYLVFCAQGACGLIFGETVKESPYWGPGLNLVNNLQTLVLMMLYIVLTKSTVDLNRSSSRLPWSQGLALLAFVTAVDLVATVARAYAPTDGAAASLIHFAAKAMPWATAFASGAAMALVVGRLDSKFANPPTWAVILLYLYALIQVLWERFETSPLLVTAILSAALVLKCLLFLVVSWMLQSGVMFFYLDRLADLLVNVERQRADYLERLWRDPLDRPWVTECAPSASQLAPSKH
jgi:hypothetical protein